MLLDTEAARSHGEACAGPAARPRRLALRTGLAGAAIALLIAACTSPEPEIVPAMAPAAPSDCAVEWPADHNAPPVMRCGDGSRQTIRPGAAMVTGDPVLLDALP